MGGTRSIGPWRDLQTLFSVGTVVGLSDRELLERFHCEPNAAGEAAFEGIVARHGPMVWRVCRAVLPDPNDAQDAFQATFLVLVRRRGSVRGLESLGGWLYGTAHKVAARARVEAARRRAVEGRAAGRFVDSDRPALSNEAERRELVPIVQEEVARLPEKYRAVVVLYYWESATHEQAAARLGVPLGTVRSRLARARNLLGRRLARRGVGSTEGAAIDRALCGFLVPGAPALAHGLIRLTVQAGTSVAAGRGAAGAVSTAVSVLVQSVLRSTMMLKLKAVALCATFASVGAVGAILAAPQEAPKRKGPPVPAHSRRDGPGQSTRAQPPIKVMKEYKIQPPDMILVEVLEALPGRPISGERLVQPDGKISLGYYGEVHVAGLTTAEIKEKVVEHLRNYLSDSTLGLVWIDPDTGKSKIDPRTRKAERIDPRDTDRVFVEVTNYNSHVYYLQGAVLVPGRIPITGSETVLDALSFAQGLTPLADRAHAMLYRMQDDRTLRAIPIDIDAITKGDDPSTNYQLEPGDRLVVPELPASETDDAKALRALLKEDPESDDAKALRALLKAENGASPAVNRPASNSGGAREKTGGLEAQVEDRIRAVEWRLQSIEKKLDTVIDKLSRPRRTGPGE